MYVGSLSPIPSKPLIIFNRLLGLMQAIQMEYALRVLTTYESWKTGQLDERLPMMSKYTEEVILFSRVDGAVHLWIVDRWMDYDCPEWGVLDKFHSLYCSSINGTTRCLARCFPRSIAPTLLGVFFSSRDSKCEAWRSEIFGSCISDATA